MFRSHSLQFLPLINNNNHPTFNCKVNVNKSLPNIDIFTCSKTNKETSGEVELAISGGLKRQNSKRVKLLQKTWAAVKTIIHPSGGRRNSKAKQQSEDQISPTAKKYTNSSSSVPTTPNKKHTAAAAFDFNIDAVAAAAAISSAAIGHVANSRPSTSQQHNQFQISHSQSYNQNQDQQRYCYYNPNFTTSRRSRSIDLEDDDDEVIRNYVELQKRLSDELHQAIVHKDEKKKDEVLSEEFKKRLQLWDMWKASTGKYKITEEELQQLIPSDFSKKLQEWEYIKTRPKDEATHNNHDLSSLSSTGGGRYHDGDNNLTDSKNAAASGKKIQRKKKSSEVNRQKELAWLEKQLEKIECEKKRLEREMKKYCERESRLEKMREALKNSPGPKEEVWIKTPTAECKVEGINEKFTKKLYKWEERQGIEPESSTMALLNPKYYSPTREKPQILDTVELNLPEANSDHEGCPQLELPKREYTSSDESDQADCEYDEATDSFATKDESRASGASNTDSECFNLKPVAGFRRRSSDAISTPLSTQSLSGCTSDEEENFMLKTVNENEEDKVMIDEKQPIFKAKPILMDDEDDKPRDDMNGEMAINSVIVPTKRTIFKPVEPDQDDLEEHKLVRIENLISPTMIKNIVEQMSAIPSPTAAGFSKQHSGQTSTSPLIIGETWKNNMAEAPKIVGVVRKCSDASTISAVSCASSLTPLSIPSCSACKSNGSQPVSFSPPRPFPKMGGSGKIPVWCSPMLARRRIYPDSKVPQETFKPNSDFSIDRFLEESKLILPSTTCNENAEVCTSSPPVPIRPSKIPITSPNILHRKYTIGGGFPPSPESPNGKVRLINLTRSSSFQGTTRRQQVQIPRLESKPPIPTNSADTTKVAKSKSTGSILGNSASTSSSNKGLLSLAATKFGLGSSSTSNSNVKAEKGNKLLPGWLRHSPQSNSTQKK